MKKTLLIFTLINLSLVNYCFSQYIKTLYERDDITKKYKIPIVGGFKYGANSEKTDEAKEIYKNAKYADKFAKKIISKTSDLIDSESVVIDQTFNSKQDINTDRILDRLLNKATSTTSDLLVTILPLKIEKKSKNEYATFGVLPKDSEYNDYEEDTLADEEENEEYYIQDMYINNFKKSYKLTYLISFFDLNTTEELWSGQISFGKDIYSPKEIAEEIYETLDSRNLLTLN